MRKTTAQELEDRLIDFASRIIDVVEALPKGPIARHLGGQVVRSGTSPALNYGEARGAESSSDFVHKLRICLKELRETFICIKIINKRDWFNDGKLQSIRSDWPVSSLDRCQQRQNAALRHANNTKIP